MCEYLGISSRLTLSLRLSKVVISMGSQEMAWASVIGARYIR